MAYKKQIDRECMGAGCVSKAKWEVFNRQNSSYGYFCRTHADSKVGEMTIKEHRNDEAHRRESGSYS